MVTIGSCQSSAKQPDSLSNVFVPSSGSAGSGKITHIYRLPSAVMLRNIRSEFIIGLVTHRRKLTIIYSDNFSRRRNFVVESDSVITSRTIGPCPMPIHRMGIFMNCGKSGVKEAHEGTAVNNFHRVGTDQAGGTTFEMALRSPNRPTCLPVPLLVVRVCRFIQIDRLMDGFPHGQRSQDGWCNGIGYIRQTCVQTHLSIPRPTIGVDFLLLSVFPSGELRKGGHIRRERIYISST